MWLLLHAFDSHLIQGDWGARAIAGVTRRFGNFIRHVLAFHYLAENGVFVVQPGRRRYGDEKLAAVRPWTGVSHGKLARFGMLLGRMKLIGERIAWSTASIAARAAALNHEIRNHAVKRQTIVIVLLLFLPGHLVGEFFGPLRQAYEIGHRFGRFLLEQANHNIALRSLKYSVLSCGSTHAFSSRTIVHEAPQTAPVPPFRACLHHSFVRCIIVW